MQLKPITAIIVLLLLVASLLVSGCTVNTTSPSTTPSPTQQESVASPTPTPTPTPTASPSTVDYSSKLNEYFGAKGYMSIPFHKTTVNGRACYEGTVVKTGTSAQERAYPMQTLNDAVAFREQLITKYKSQGWTTYDSDSDSWSGKLGSKLVSISSTDESIIDTPITLEIIV